MRTCCCTVVALVGLLRAARAQYLPLPHDGCSTATEAAAIDVLNVSSILGQFDTGQTAVGYWGSGAASQPATGGPQDVLRLVALATVGQQSSGFSNVTNFLATLIVDTTVLSFSVFSNQSALCSSIRNTAAPTDPTTGCPYGPGDVAFGIQVPLRHAYPLTSIVTRIRVLDTSVPPLQLACYDVPATPYYPHAWPYPLFLWLPVGMAIGYAVVIAVGRVWAAYISVLLDREAMLASSLTAKLSPQGLRQRFEPVLWAAASGVGLQSSGPLKRFATPGAYDIIYLLQWVAIHGMIAVSWPHFVYPIYAKTAWSMLTFNATITQDASEHLDPLRVQLPQTPFDAQIRDPASPLYLNAALPNSLLHINQSRSGLDSWSAVVGLRRQDLFGICASIFLMIVAGVIALSLLVFLLDYAAARLWGGTTATAAGRRRSTGDGIVYAQKGSSDRDEDDEEYDSKPQSRRSASSPPNRRWYQGLNGVSATAHGQLAQGNLTRILLLFHFPLTIYAAFQLSLASSDASRASVVLAGFSLAFFSFLIPLALVMRIYRAPTRMLQEDAGTLLAYGPLYNVFSERSYSFVGIRFLYNLVMGIVIGTLQNSGTAQAIVLLVLEIGETLLTSLWLPWGDGAAMGPLSFVLSVARIVTAVLLIVLSPAVNVGISAAGWIAYVILVIQAVVGALLFVILLIKAVELLVRIFGGVPFDDTNRARSGGLFGALRRWDRAGKKNMRHSRPLAAPRRPSTALEVGSSQHMLGSRPTSMHTASHYGELGGSYRSQTSPAVPLTEDLDEGYIMSPMSGGCWQGGSSSGARGDYISPADYRTRSPSWNESGPTTSFAVVRGGKATDQSPYTLASQPNRGRNSPQQNPGADYFDRGTSPRARTRSFSAQIEYAGEPSSSSALPLGARPAPARPPSVNLLSNHPAATSSPEGTLGPSTGTSKAAKRQSGASTLLGFFRRGSNNDVHHDDTSDDEDDDDDDDEDDDGRSRGGGGGVRWPFGIRGRRRTPTPEPASMSGEGEGGGGGSEEAPSKSFVVVRPNKPAPRLPPPVGEGL